MTFVRLVCLLLYALYLDLRCIQTAISLDTATVDMYNLRNSLSCAWNIHPALYRKGDVFVVRMQEYSTLWILNEKKTLCCSCNKLVLWRTYLTVGKLSELLKLCHACNYGHPEIITLVLESCKFCTSADVLVWTTRFYDIFLNSKIYVSWKYFGFTRDHLFSKMAVQTFRKRLAKRFFHFDIRLV